MANYTMTLEEIRNESFYEWFPSDFPFYIDDERMKQAFKEKFYLHYMNREIGFESPYLFVKKLEALLVIKMPYYRQLYETELKSKDINFLLNKDLKETFIREIDSENQSSGTSSMNQNSVSSNTLSQNDTSSQSGTSSTEHKESLIRDGVASSSLNEGHLTGISADTGESATSVTNTTTGSNDLTGDVSSTGETSQTQNEKSIEKTELLSQGNIGITSSAQLLKEWRDVLINIDEIIINDCKKLFMTIY